MPKALDQPLVVVARDELGDDPARLFQALELMEVEALLLEGSDEALDHAVALGLPDVGRGDRHAEPEVTEAG